LVSVELDTINVPFYILLHMKIPFTYELGTINVPLYVRSMYLSVYIIMYDNTIYILCKWYYMYDNA